MPMRPAGTWGGEDRADRRKSEAVMFRKAQEYLLDELIEHPILGMQIETGGIERRCLDLMLDGVSEHHRFTEGEQDVGRRLASS